MEEIQWTDDLSVGVRLFDSQHKRLVRMLNTMIRGQKTGMDASEISDMLTSMTQYALEHFDSEEKLMTKHEYPGFETHKAEHDAFKAKVLDMLSSQSDTSGVSREILTYLGAWLSNHIMGTDKKFKSFFNDLGVY